MASPSSVGLVASTTSSYGVPVPAALDSAIEQLADLEPIGPDTVHWRDRAVKDVVAALERAGALDGQDVERLLDHAQAGVVARRIGADGAQRTGADVEARLAVHDLFANGDEGGGQHPCLSLRGPQQVVCQPLSRLGADAGQA